MITFLDKYKNRKKTFVLYGDLNDIVMASDLVCRSFEEYLVALLKEHGYQHVIFFNSDGNRGAYCLDAESARFFFTENSKYPKPASISSVSDLSKRTQSQISKPQNISTTTTTTGSVVSDELDEMLDLENTRKDISYQPGSLSNASSDELWNTTETNHFSKNDITTQQSSSTASNKKICYSHRGQSESFFLSTISELMRREDSHMALIFYDLQTLQLGQINLVDMILNQWENPKLHNICLLMARETDCSTNDMCRRLENAGLGAAFTVPSPSDPTILFPKMNRCFRPKLPCADEVANILRHYAIVGTPNGNKLRFKYTQLAHLADNLLLAAGKNAIALKESDGTVMPPNAIHIYNELCAYIDTNSKNGILYFNDEEIQKMWNVQFNKEVALESLHIPGWEAAYDKLQEVIESSRITQEQLRTKESQADQKNKPGIEVERMNLEAFFEERPEIPCFLILGNPGTGKTEIARKIGKILQEAGILKIGDTIESNRGKLISSYIGGVPKAVMAEIERAEESVLFIDEAHLLGMKDGGANHEGTGYEVISTLNHVITNPNYHVSVILAGYEDKMKSVLDLDPGFRRRFGDNIIRLNDYQPELLTSILLDMLRKQGLEVDANLINISEENGVKFRPIHSMVERLYAERDRTKFGNAGDMEKLSEYVKSKLKDDRVVTKESFFGGSDGKITEKWFHPMNITATASSLIEEMNKRFVGMDSIKQEIRRIGLMLEDQKARGISDENTLKSILLVGNPGVGKSSVAEYIAKLYFSYGLLGSPQPIIVSASEFASSNVGGSQTIVHDYIKQAQDKKALIFVDEAHELLNAHFDGKGAIKAFMAPMTDRNHPFLTCFAVYPDEKEAFLKLDKGLYRRLRIIHLEDYKGYELYEIMQRFIAKQGLQTTETLNNLLKKVTERIYRRRTSQTGNAGFIENIVLEMDDNRRNRCEMNAIPFNTNESTFLSPEDVPQRLRDGLNTDPPSDVSEQFEAIFARFDKEIVGMKNVRKQLHQIAMEVRETISLGKDIDNIKIRPLMLVGNPGTGKTLISSKLAEIYTHFGLLNTDELVVVNAASLNQPVEDLIRKAQDRRACLFVDEAHRLLDSQFGRAQFGKFMAPLTEYNKPFLVCFASYPQLDKDLMRLDPGGESRFTIIELEDYTTTELMEIMHRKIVSEELTVDQATVKQLEKLFNYVYQTRNTNTGNGRFVERLLEKMNSNRRERCDELGIDIDNPKRFVLLPDDIPEEYHSILSIDEYDSPIERIHKIIHRIESERVGLTEMKTVLLNIAKSREYSLHYDTNQDIIYPGHYFFTGNPGTGKTTATEFFAKYLYELGVVSSPKPIIIGASNLVAEYEGQTAVKTEERLMNSVGHVLVIDEAYALANRGFQSSSFNQQAVDKIVQVIDRDEFRSSTSVIFLGYEKDLRLLYDMNPGFKNRVSEISFPDFTEEQSFDVLISIMKSLNYYIDNKAIQSIQQQITEMHSSSDFANGRTVRNYCMLLIERVKERALQNIYVYSKDDKRIHTIFLEDIPSISVVFRSLNL